MNKVDSAEEKLAELIEVLFSWIERENPALLAYGSINLRGALERFFYFSGLHNTQNLKPLLMATSAWRNGEVAVEHAETYDQLKTLGKTSLASRIRIICGNLKRFFKLCSLSIPDHMKYNGYSVKRQPTCGRPIGFFAINPRFVGFFDGVICRLKDEQIVFFSDNPKEIEAQVRKVGGALAIGPSSKPIWKNIHISVHHDLFPVYSIALLTYLRLEGVLRTYLPSALVFAEGTSMGDELASQAAKALGIPTARLQSGRAGVLHNGYRRMSFDKMLCWGEGFVERYKIHSPHSDYLVTGSPFLDEVMGEERKKMNIICVFTQPISTHINKQDYKLLAELTECLIHDIPNVRILVRKHPVDEAKGFDVLSSQYPSHIKMMSYFDSSLQDVLQQSSIAIGFFSTTLSEAAACGVVPVILHLKDQHSVFPFPERYGAAILADDVEEARHLIMDLLEQPELVTEIRENMRFFARKFFGPQDGLAMERIVNAIRRLGCSQDAQVFSENSVNNSSENYV